MNPGKEFGIRGQSGSTENRLTHGGLLPGSAVNAGPTKMRLQRNACQWSLFRGLGILHHDRLPTRRKTTLNNRNKFRTVTDWGDSMFAPRGIASINHRVRSYTLTIASRLLGWPQRKSSRKLLFETSSYLNSSRANDLEKIHDRFLIPSGWVESRSSRKSVDREGNFIPWLSYGSIAFLEKLPLENLSILEFGAGASTLWFVERCPRLVSIETDDRWYLEIKNAVGNSCSIHSLSNLAAASQKTTPEIKIPTAVLSRDLPTNSSSTLADLGAASSSLKNLIENADIILVDGGPRNCFLWLVRNFSKPSAIWVIDNSDSNEIAETLSEVDDDQYLRVGFWGLSPINAFAAETSIVMSYHGLATKGLRKTLAQLWAPRTVPNFFSDDRAPAAGP
jgi:hypothetical protein